MCGARRCLHRCALYMLQHVFYSSLITGRCGAGGGGDDDVMGHVTASARCQFCDIGYGAGWSVYVMCLCSYSLCDNMTIWVGTDYTSARRCPWLIADLSVCLSVYRLPLCLYPGYPLLSCSTSNLRLPSGMLFAVGSEVILTLLTEVWLAVRN